VKSVIRFSEVCKRYGAEVALDRFSQEDIFIGYMQRGRTESAELAVAEAIQL